MLSALETVQHALTLFLVGFGLAYFFGGVVLGYRFWGRTRKADDTARRSTNDYAVFFLVAALDEASVIGDTVRRLVANPDVTVVLVDDGSSDDTANIARMASDHRCVVLTRSLPDAQLGKGAALNAGFTIVRQEVARRGLDADHTLVCVMDADGHLSDGAVERVKVLFDDERVGGVQLPVRIRNRRSAIERLQDLEFWALSALSQFARVAFGNVSLGGNGQFTRLSVLYELEDDPWSASLTEDLDLAVRITLGGHRLVSTPMAWVDQQAIRSWRRLLRQRTRWMQGHMTCGAYIRRLLRSPKVSNAAAIETVLYLSVPWVLVLPWSILFHVAWTQTIISIARFGLPIHVAGVIPVIAYCIYLYLVSFLPMVIAGLIYRRRDPSVGWIRSVLIGHLLIAGFYVAMIASWRALYRMLRGKSRWDKTARLDESVDTFLTVKDEFILAELASPRTLVAVSEFAPVGVTQMRPRPRPDYRPRHAHRPLPVYTPRPMQCQPAAHHPPARHRPSTSVDRSLRPPVQQPPLPQLSHGRPVGTMQRRGRRHVRRRLAVVIAVVAVLCGLDTSASAVSASQCIEQ